MLATNSQLQRPTHQSVTVYARRQLGPSGGVVTSAWSPRCGQAMEPSASIAEALRISPKWEECSAESAQCQKCNKHLATFSVKSLRACFSPARTSPRFSKIGSASSNPLLDHSAADFTTKHTKNSQLRIISTCMTP
jgi:hypothetical protein